MTIARLIILLPISFVACIANVLADETIVGLVVDYSPRVSDGPPLITIERNGTSIAVKEHEILYKGDRLVFADGAGPKAYVRAKVDKQKEIVLDPAHNTLPAERWAFLQSLAPQLMAAYRWVNSPAGIDKSRSQNALSRGTEEGEELSVLAGVKGNLSLSANSSDPLWIGWRGGDPPYAVSLAQGEKVLRHADVCVGQADADCVREITLPLDAGDATLILSITSADGASWRKEITREKIGTDDALKAPEQLGNLGTFLGATELLDRNADAFVLESARRLATISSTYPPARTLLDNIKSGDVPNH